MAWVRPRRSRPGQEGGVAGNSGGTGGSSLPGDGPAAPGGRDTGLGRWREARPFSIHATAVTTRRPTTSGNGLTLLASSPCGCCPLILVAICESNRHFPQPGESRRWPPLRSLKALIRSHAAGEEDRSFSVTMQVETRAAHQEHGQNYDGSGSG